MLVWPSKILGFLRIPDNIRQPQKFFGVSRPDVGLLCSFRAVLGGGEKDFSAQGQRGLFQLDELFECSLLWIPLRTLMVALDAFGSQGEVFGLSQN